MPQILEKRNIRYLLLGAAGLLAVIVYIVLPLAFLLPLLLFRPPEQPPVTEPVTTAPPSNLEKNPYAPEDFVLTEEGYLQCLSADASFGIDVSGFQGEIDWQQVQSAGVEFVFIRVGGRGYGKEGTLYTDDWAQAYYTGAKAAGLKVGAYFFSQAITPDEAQEEALLALEQIRHWQMDLPLVYDWEWVSSDARTAQLDGETLTLCTDRFCSTVREAGVEPMIYFNVNQGLYMLDLEQLYSYRFWLAMYDASTQFPYRVDYWQYSCSGTVPGIDTPVDLNLYLPIPDAGEDTLS